MKLIMCPSCQDVVRLIEKAPRWCMCKKVGGIYTDGTNAEVWGPKAVMIGFGNSTLVEAIKNRPDRAKEGVRFLAFVIPRECSSVKFVKAPKSIKELCDGKIITE